MPVNDRTSGVLHHLFPVLQLQPFPVVADLHSTNRIRAPCVKKIRRETETETEREREREVGLDILPILS